MDLLIFKLQAICWSQHSFWWCFFSILYESLAILWCKWELFTRVITNWFWWSVRSWTIWSSSSKFGHIKVSDFHKRSILRTEYIVWFKISMTDKLSMQILNRCENLSKNLRCNMLTVLSKLCKHIEHFLGFNQLHDCIDPFLLLIDIQFIHRYYIYML